MAHSASTDFTRFQFCRKLAWIASWFPPLSPKCRSRPLPPVPVAFADRAARASFDRPSILPDLFVFAFAFFVIAWFRQRWEIDELTPAASVDHPHGFERERHVGSALNRQTADTSSLPTMGLPSEIADDARTRRDGWVARPGSPDAADGAGASGMHHARTLVPRYMRRQPASRSRISNPFLVIPQRRHPAATKQKPGLVLLTACGSTYV